MQTDGNTSCVEVADSGSRDETGVHSISCSDLGLSLQSATDGLVELCVCTTDRAKYSTTTIQLATDRQAVLLVTHHVHC